VAVPSIRAAAPRPAAAANAGSQSCRSGMSFATACRGSVGRLAHMRGHAGGHQLLCDIPPAGAPLDRERDIVAPGEPRHPGAQVLPVGRDDLTPLDLPAHRVDIVERQLLPVDIQPAYDRHPDLLKLPGRPARRPARELLANQS
jgi:hypothetical protein